MLYSVCLTTIDKFYFVNWHSGIHMVRKLPCVDDLLRYKGTTYLVSDIHIVGGLVLLDVVEVSNILAPAFPSHWR